jgi:hypothetical protein
MNAQVLFALRLVLLLSIEFYSQALTLQNVQLMSRGHGVAVADQALVSTSDSGKHWVNITPPLQSGSLLKISQGVSSSFFLDANIGWVAIASWTTDGDQRAVDVEIARTINGGKSWTTTSIMVPEIIKAGYWGNQSYMTFLDQRNGWLELQRNSGVNFKDGSLFATHDGGHTWLRLPDPPTTDTMSFATANIGWISGGPGGGYLYRTLDGGQTWKEQEVSVPPQAANPWLAQYGSPKVDESGNGFLHAIYEGPRSKPDFYTSVIYQTSDFGRTWKPVQITADISTNGIAFAQFGSSFKLIYGQSGKTITAREISANGIQTLRSTKPPGFKGYEQEGFGAWKAYFIDADSGWILGGYYSCPNGKPSCTSTDKLYSTEDGGSTLEDITPTSPDSRQK